MVVTAPSPAAKSSASAQGDIEPKTTPRWSFVNSSGRASDASTTAKRNIACRSRALAPDIFLLAAANASLLPALVLLCPASARATSPFTPSPVVE